MPIRMDLLGERQHLNTWGGRYAVEIHQGFAIEVKLESDTLDELAGKIQGGVA